MPDKETKVEIAAYSLEHFPKTQDESTELSRAKVAKQYRTTMMLIEGAFQDVFRKNWDDSFRADCRYISQGDKQVMFYKNRPFIELGDFEESFEMKNGTQHMVISQSYRVL